MQGSFGDLLLRNTQTGAQVGPLGMGSRIERLEDADLALPVTKPWSFFAGYEVELSDSEAERIGVNDPALAEVFVTVRAAEGAQNFSANLRAPIIISAGRGFQVINEADDAPVRAPLFAQPVS